MAKWIIDPGDQSGNLICLVTKSKFLTEIRLPFWAVTKIRAIILGVQNVVKREAELMYVVSSSHIFPRGILLRDLVIN